ncbi:MAG: hypothetical protein KKG59_01100 [Nanoarchaeota archaeon]|nr:hypothetical protein [Nanoarchaeota archaeon]
MKKEGKVFIAGLLVFLFIFSIAIFFAMAANDGAESTDIIATIRTEGCDADGICYVKTGDNTILFDVPSSVSEKQILFNLPALTITKKVKECGQGLCIGEARLSCQSGSQIAINIVDTPSFKSKDDLGNKIKNEPTKFRCDNDPPVFLMNGNDPQVSIQSGSGDPFFKSGDTIIIRANVTDEVSPINAKADFTELEGPEDLEGTCVFRVDHYECEITHVAPEGPLNDKSVIATFSDYAGNSISHTFEGIDVLKVENLEIDAWRLRNAMPQPSSLNLNLIKYYPKKVFVSFSLARKTGRYDIIKAETEGCHMVEQPGIGMNADEVVLDFKPKSRRGSFGISLSQRHFPTDVTPQFNCSLIITNKKGSTIIGTPEREYAVFTMNTYETELPTDVLNAERQKIYDDIEKDRVKIDQTMQTFKAAQAICGILAGGDGTSGIMQGMFWTPVVGEGLRRGGKRLGGAMDKIREVPLVKPLCDMVLCQSKYQTLVTDTLNSLPVASQMNDLATGISGSPASGVDPYDSILMAAITACGPAYYYNLQKINQLDCEYFRCVRDDTASGFPIEACGASRAYMTCKYTMGGWTKLIPGIGPLYNAVRDVFNVLRNPVGAITMGLSLLCRVRSHLPAPVDATCGVTEQIQKMNNDIETVRTMIQRFREMRENAPSDRCAEIMESGALPESDDPNPIDNPGIFTDHVVCGETGYCFIRHDDGRVFATDRDNNWYEVDETNDLYRLESTSDNHMQLYGQRTGAEEDADEPVAWLNPEDGNPMTDVESYKKEADKWKTEAERDEAEFANADAAWQRAREEAGTDYDADALDEARTLEENYLAFRASEDIFVDDLSYTPYTFEDCMKIKDLILKRNSILHTKKPN